MAIGHLVLEVISGPHQGQRIEVEPGSAVKIGRTIKADITLQDTFMSGEHFAVECNKDICKILDLKSTNGTSLNGKRIKAEQLNDGDQIHAGRTDFVVRMEPQSHGISPGSFSGVAASESFEGDTDTPESYSASSAASVGAPKPSPDTSSIPKAVSNTDVMKAAAAQKPNVAEEPRPPVAVQAPNVPEIIPQTPRAPVEDDLRVAWNTYQEATSEGQLLRILYSQPQSLMALVDDTHEPRISEYLHSSGDEYRSLYRENLCVANAPLLVRLRPQSDFLKRMVTEGWGKGWGIFLSCDLPLAKIRDYFREALMISLPDGTELFSRFYDPKFFRTFLETCTSAEAEKFFGPITSYLMESDRHEILLQFRRNNGRVEKQGHLLSTLE
jgi:pSer/pThr/pTyr-binding forkhead associated (FHA) protein